MTDRRGRALESVEPGALRVCAFLCAAGLASRVEADPPPPAPSPLATAPGVRLFAEGLRFYDEAGAERARIPIAPRALDRSAPAPTLERLSLSGHSIVHLSAALAGSRRRLEGVFDVEKPRTLDLEETGPDKDGERSLVLRVDASGIVRYQTSPTMRRCDGDQLLFPEAWSFERERFVPVIDPPPTGPPLAVRRWPRVERTARPIGLFHFTAASTASGAERRADRLGAPVELEDGKMETVWQAGPAGHGEGQWVAARSEGGGHLVSALEIIPGPGSAPSELTLLFDDKVRYSIALLPGGAPSWVELEPPQRASCVSLVVAKASAPGSSGTSLGEVRLYSELDDTGGVARLADELAASLQGADAAAHVLEKLGAPAAKAVAQRLATARGPGHRRLLEVLAQVAGADDAKALGQALETAAAEERAVIVSGLARLGAAGVAEAARIYTERSEAPDARVDAARVLALQAKSGTDRVAARRALLDGAGAGPPAVRMATVRALGEAAAGSPEVVDEAAHALESAPEGSNTERIGDLARALGGARRSEARPRAAAVLSGALARITDADTRLRIVRAMGDLGDPELATALDEAEAHASGDEVLRWAAVEAAAQLEGERARPTLRRAASDPDPRVRRAALLGLAKSLDDDGAHRLAAALRGDPWPLVRRAAAEGLGARCPQSSGSAAGAALALAVTGEGELGRGADPSEEVRRAALLTLFRCAPSSPAIERALSAHHQPLSVRELAAAELATRGGAEAARALADVLDEVLNDPGADERAAGLAVACLRGLGRAGSSATPILESIGAASREPLSPSVRAAAMETIGHLCPQGASAALGRGARDPDPAVRRAAEAARVGCHR